MLEKLFRKNISKDIMKAKKNWSKLNMKKMDKKMDQKYELISRISKKKI